MIALVNTIDEHSEAVEYDLISHGLRLRDWPSDRLSWRDMWVLVRQAPPGSALHRAMDPAWQASIDAELLRGMEHSLRWLVWAKTTDAPRGRNVPEPVAFPWDPEPEGTVRGDAMTFEEANDFLGWEIEMGEG